MCVCIARRHLNARLLSGIKCKAFNCTPGSYRGRPALTGGPRYLQGGPRQLQNLHLKQFNQHAYYILSNLINTHFIPQLTFGRKHSETGHSGLLPYLGAAGSGGCASTHAQQPLASPAPQWHPRRRLQHQRQVMTLTSTARRTPPRTTAARLSMRTTSAP